MRGCIKFNFEKCKKYFFDFDVPDENELYTTPKVVQKGWVFIQSEDKIKIEAIFMGIIDFGDPLNR